MWLNPPPPYSVGTVMPSTPSFAEAVDHVLRDALLGVDPVGIDLGLQERVDLREQGVGPRRFVGVLLRVGHELVELQPAEEERLDEPHLGRRRRFEQVLGFFDLFLILRV